VSRAWRSCTAGNGAGVDGAARRVVVLPLTSAVVRMSGSLDAFATSRGVSQVRVGYLKESWVPWVARIRPSSPRIGALIGWTP